MEVRRTTILQNKAIDLRAKTWIWGLQNTQKYSYPPPPSTSFFFFYETTTLIVLAFSTISFHLRRSWTCSAHSVSTIFPSRFGPSSWSSCEWFPFVYSSYYASFGHSVYVSKPTQTLGFNIIYHVPVFNSTNSLFVLGLHMPLASLAQLSTRPYLS